MQENEKIQLFENAPIPGAVAKLAVPMIFSSLVMVLYNMADTYFVGMMNDPVENAAVSLAAPAILNVVMAYLVRSEGAALHASIGTMSGCLLNIVLDPVFILPWGLNMGAAGAGLATFLSNCVACVYFFVLLYVKRGNTFVCIDPGKFRLKKRIVVEVCGVGIPERILSGDCIPQC